MRGYGNRRGAGGRQQPDTTTLLPAALRKELGMEAEDGGGAKHAGRDRNNNTVFGRKDARKDARTANKNPRGGFSHSQNSTLKRKYGDELQRTPSRPATSSAPPPKKAKTVPAPGTNSNGRSSASSKAKGKERVASKPAIEEPKISKGKQRKHVDAAAQTPLERMLAAQKSNGTSSSASTMPGDAVPRNRKKRSQMTQAEKDEADEIAWLEAKLKLDREGGDDGEADDGLGVLIRELDRYQTGMFDKPAEDDADEQDVSEEEDESDDEESSDGDAGEDDLESDEDFELEDGEEIQLNEGADDEEEADAAEEEEAEEEAEQRVEDGKTSIQKAATSSAPTTSGKYVPPALRRAAAEAETASSSVLKTASLAPTADPKLTRTLNGLLNRLSSANLDAIMADLVETYRSNPRAVVTQTLVRLVLETVALQPNLVDSIVIMYAALFAALGRSVGVEFGAEAVQVLTGKLVHAHAQIRRRQQRAGGAVGADGLDDKAGRECLNLAVLLAHAYNLHLIAAPIVYDIVRLCLREPAAIRAGRDLEAMHLRSTAQQPIEFAEDGDEPKVMYEIDVELLLKLVKACGGQMRSDDPSALRDIVSLTQERINDASSQGTSSLGSRSRFMLEALVDLQKARSKPKAGAAAFGADGTVAAEALGRYKKYIAGMVRRPDRLLRSSAASGMGSTDEPLLNIGLRDLADSTRKGRWWLVGAAWTGHDKDDEDDVEPAAEGVTAKRKLAKTGSKSAGDSNSGVVGTSTGTEEANLLILAREHGMNTDARKGVFITLMSSEDYIDASQKLLGLGLNEVQRREVVRVLLHCLGSEPIYNPYYVLIGQQLASDSGAAGGPALATSSTSGVISTRVTMQYCLWDYFREIGESDVGGATMIAGKGDDDGEDGDDFKGFDDVFGETNDGGEGGLASVSRKMIHLARAYGWWIAKNALNLNMLRTVNFAGLKQRGRAFIQLLLVHMLLSIQTASPTKTLTMSWNAEKSASRYRASIENVLVRGTAGNLELARGLLIFVKRYMRPAEVVQVVGGSGIKKGTRQALEWAVKVSEEVLEVGIQVAGQV